MLSSSLPLLEESCLEHTHGLGLLELQLLRLCRARTSCARCGMMPNLELNDATNSKLLDLRQIALFLKLLGCSNKVMRQQPRVPCRALRAADVFAVVDEQELLG